MDKWVCPKCARGGFKKGGDRKRPGWECLSCGIFFPSDTWEAKDGTIKRKYPTKPRRKGYVDAEAMRTSNVLQRFKEGPYMGYSYDGGDYGYGRDE